MKTFALRLHPGQDLKEELIAFTKNNNIHAGIILTGVGSLTKATLRLADETITKTFDSRFEIVSLVGTLCQEGVHLHISLSDEQGNTIGGHLKEGCLIYVTAEIVIAELEQVRFSRVFDQQTGFKELVIENQSSIS